MYPKLYSTNAVTTKFQILYLSGYKRGDYFCLGGSGKLNLKIHFDLGLACIAISKNVGNWCLLGNTEQSDLVEVCRDLIMAEIKLERLVGLHPGGLWCRAKEVRHSLES